MQRILDLRHVFVVILFGGICVLGCRNITDPDFWWHLRTGQYILETRSVPHVDPFSFTREGQPWVAHEWLSELTIYGLYRGAGWGGLIVGFGAVTAATFFFLYLRCPARPYVAGVLVLLGAFACRPTWGVRPQSLSLLLASILLWLLEESAHHRNLIWWIVPLVLLWANLHAGYSLGIALILLWLMGSWLDVRLGWQDAGESASRLGALPIALLFSTLLVVLNPNGLRLYSYPFETLRSPSMQKHIIEWFSPDFHRGEFLPFLMLVLAIVVAPALTELRTSPRKLLLVCVTALGALQSNRLIPVFVLIAVPVLSKHVGVLMDSRPWGRRFGKDSSPTLKASLNAAILATLIIVATLHVRYVIGQQPTAEAAAFPEGAVDFLRRQADVSPLLNNYGWGGYLIWKLSREKVFIDGRADLYGDDFVERFFSAYSVNGDWKQELERWKIATVIVPADAALATALARDRSWRQVFYDSQAVILTRIPEVGQTSLSAVAGNHRKGLPHLGIDLSGSPYGQ